MSLPLGLHFALRTRDGRVRTLLVALASGFAIALLLLAVSVPSALAARDARSDARNPQLVDPATTGQTRWGDVDFVSASGPVTGAVVVPGRGPRPPGVTQWPAMGTMLVSPALAGAIRHDPLLAARLPYRITGRLGAANLLGPSELRFLAADPGAAKAGVAGLAGFDPAQPTAQLDPVLALLLVVGVVVLLLPIAVVVVIAGRFGAERRDRRLAALRLAGLSTRGTTAVLGVEALSGGIAGVATGVGVFLAARQLLRFLSVASLSVFPEDAVPPAPLAALVLLVVPTTVVVAALAGLRGVAVEPLGVSRRTGRPARRLWWRLGPLIVGAIALGSTGGSFDQDRSGNVALVAVGVTLLLVSAVALLPWIVERIARVAPGRSVPWRFARGRLVHEGGTTVRVVGAVCALTAGAIALQMLFAGLAAGYARDGSSSRSAALLTAPLDEARSVAARLAAPGRRVVIDVDASVVGRSDEQVRVYAGSCADLSTIATIADCRTGRTYLTSGETFAAPGELLALGARRWRVPERVARIGTGIDENGFTATGVLLVTSPTLPLSGAFPVNVLADTTARGLPALVRQAVPLDSTMSVLTPTAKDAPTHQFDQVRRGLTIGLVLVLMLVGAVLLVSVIDQLRGRRAALATLAAIGMRRRAMVSSILWESALPVLTGVVVAVAAGLALGLVLLRVMSRQPALDPLVAADVALAVVVPLAVTIAGLPAAARLMRPEGLRAE